MKATLCCSAEFEIELTQDEVLLIKRTGERHYDGVCRAACTNMCDGFIVEAWRKVEHALAWGDPGVAVVFWKFRQLDTAAKILEMAHPDDRVAARELTQKLHTLMSVANRTYTENRRVILE